MTLPGIVEFLLESTRLIPALAPTAGTSVAQHSSDAASLPSIYNENCEIFAGA